MSCGGGCEQDSNKNEFSCMDNIPVKIIEKYKPPKKIALPIVLQHKPISNALKHQYDFSLEKNVLEKITILSKMKEEARIRRHARVMELKNQDYLNLDKLTLLDSVQPQNTQVLQPIPAQKINFKMSSHDNKMLTNNINISDFESDTSSPFDNMELKTLNDIEELATVLQPTTVSNNSISCQLPEKSVSHYYSSPIYNNYAENHGNYEFTHNAIMQIHQPSNFNPILKSNICEDKNKEALPPVTMPNVLLQLKADINTVRYSDESPNDSLKSTASNITTNGTKSPMYSFPNPYRSLSPTSQSFTDQMHQKGFFLPRAA